MQGHRGANGADRLVEEAPEVVGVAVRIVPAPLLRGAPPNVAQDRSRELELMVAALGEDLLAVPVHHLGHIHPQDLQPWPFCASRRGGGRRLRRQHAPAMAILRTPRRGGSYLAVGTPRRQPFCACRGGMEDTR